MDTSGVSIEALVFSFDDQYIKIERLGLEVVDEEKHNLSTTTSNLESPEKMPSIKEALKTFCAASKALETAGLDKSEVLWLRTS